MAIGTSTGQTFDDAFDQALSSIKEAEPKPDKPQYMPKEQGVIDATDIKLPATNLGLGVPYKGDEDQEAALKAVQQQQQNDQQIVPNVVKTSTETQPVTSTVKSLDNSDTVPSTGRPRITVRPYYQQSNTGDLPLTSSGSVVIDRMFGLGDEARYQTWPERFLKGMGEFIVGLGNDASTIKDVAQGKYGMGRDAIDASVGPVFNIASTVATGGITTGVEKGALGLFGGEMARGTYGSSGRGAALQAAEKLEAQGQSPSTIFHTTGWERGAEGRWKFRISDVNAEVTPLAKDAQRLKENSFNSLVIDPNDARTLKAMTEGQYQVKDFLKHPELEKEYPEMMKAKVHVDLPENGSLNGQFDPATGSFHIKPSKLQDPSVLLHEIQHKIQTRENFARGGNVSKTLQYAKLTSEELATMDAQVKEWQYLRDKKVIQVRRLNEEDQARMDFLKPVVDTYGKIVTAQREAAFANYERLHGEVEARGVQAEWESIQDFKKMGWSDEEINRVMKPLLPSGWETVPREEQYIYFKEAEMGARGPVRGGSVSTAARSNPESIKSAAVNINGQNFEGPMHVDAVMEAAKKLKISTDEAFNLVDSGKMQQGFTTSEGRFVSRKDAHFIAAQAGQIYNRNSLGLDVHSLSVKKPGTYKP